MISWNSWTVVAIIRREAVLKTPCVKGGTHSNGIKISPTSDIEQVPIGKILLFWHDSCLTT